MRELSISSDIFGGGQIIIIVLLLLLLLFARNYPELKRPKSLRGISRRLASRALQFPNTSFSGRQCVCTVLLARHPGKHTNTHTPRQRSFADSCRVVCCASAAAFVASVDAGRTLNPIDSPDISAILVIRTRARNLAHRTKLHPPAPPRSVPPSTTMLRDHSCVRLRCSVDNTF